MKLYGFTLYKEQAGIISANAIWVCIYSCYLHTNESLIKLLYEVVAEYKHDRHIVG